MQSFFSRVEERAREIDSLLCIGLDPHLSDLPDHSSLQVRSARDAQLASAARDWCIKLIDQTADFAVAFKPNSAFFEQFGAKGILALQEVIEAIPAKIPVILDAKRGDIASTAEAYATAAFETLETDAITLSPYLGRDSLEPFLRNPQKGAFLLCRTSNPGSTDLQDLLVTAGAGRQPLTLYETVALLAQAWNQNDNLGLVVGATFPEALARVRLLAPQIWILSPGVGAQGADLRRALAAGLRPDGYGLLVNVSRSIARATDPRQAVEILNNDIYRERLAVAQAESRGTKPLIAPVVPVAHTETAAGLLEAGCVRFGKFTLKSGSLSPIYIDLRQLIAKPALLAQAAGLYIPLLRRLEFDRLAALPYAAVPIGTAICLQTGWPLIYPRKEVKEYGTRAEIEGAFEPGEQVVVIDDLATTGGSKFEAIQKLTAAGLKVVGVVVLIDRESGASQALAQAGYPLQAVFTLHQLLDIWEHSAAVPEKFLNATRLFLKEQG